MNDVKEVLRRWAAGQSLRRTAQASGVDRKTARRYIQAARSVGVKPASVLDEGVFEQIVLRVQQRPAPEQTDVRKTLEGLRGRIEQWLRNEPRALRLVRIHELLVREGYTFSYTALRRFAHRELGWREKPPTVRVDDAPLGEEAQIDFGLMSTLVDEQGKRRKLWALIVTLSASRYQFVWPTFTQTTRDVIEGLEAAWRFFGGMPRRVVPDNLPSAVIHADAQAPKLQCTLFEYTQLRGLFVDPARVRKPQDKARVEKQVPYVRERCFDGETFVDLAAAREHAQRWCRDVAGMRVHGTTRKVPREQYELHEKAAMQPLVDKPYDVPAWGKAKVHPDHHVQVARSLYSVPTQYIGQVLKVRVDCTTVRLYSGATLVKTHLRVQPGDRATDPSDYPPEKAAYALRSVEGVKSKACAHGEHVGRYAERLLGGPLPWAKMRQGYGLLRLCDKYGAARLDALCARALDFDVIDVPRLGRMLKSAVVVETEAQSSGKLVVLGARFARDAGYFATQTKGADQ